MNIINSIIIPSVIFVILDVAYWFFYKNYLCKTLGKIDSIYEGNNMRNVGFIAHLFIQLFALIYFLILGFSTVLNAFIFGVVLQSFSCSMNYAIVKDWNLAHSAVSTLWKGILFALTVYLSFYVF